jgi:hypothetical protein
MTSKKMGVLADLVSSESMWSLSRVHVISRGLVVMMALWLP